MTVRKSRKLFTLCTDAHVGKDAQFCLGSPALFKACSLPTPTLRYLHFCPTFHLLSYLHPEGSHFTHLPLWTMNTDGSLVQRQ